MAELPPDITRIERRLSSVRAVSGIVQAIWALSKAQLAQVEEFSQEATLHLDWVDEVVARVAGPQLMPHPAAATLHVVLGPARSFCGRLARDTARALPADGPLGICGQRLLDQVQARSELRTRIVFGLAGPSSVDDLESVSAQLAYEVLTHGQGRPVALLYPCVGASGLRSVSLLSGPRALRSHWDFEAYSSEERLLEVAVSESVTGHLRVGLAEALRSEVRARAAAAEAAKQAVERQRDALTSSLRVLQREQITAELAELYAGHLTPAR